MVNTVKIPDLPIKLTPVANDLAVIADSQSSNSLKKIQLSTIASSLDYASSLSTDTNNLLNTDGSNKLLLRASDELISTDLNNNISVGADGKLYGSATSIVLPEGQFLVGDGSNQPVATPPEEAKLALGLPIDYKNVSVLRDSGTQVTVQGKCRSEQDDIDLELPSATPVALLAPVANTRYNLFFAKVNSTSPTVALFSTASVPAGYAHYRRILTVPTNSTSTLSNFIYNNNTKVLEVELWAGLATSGTINLSDDIANYSDLYPIGFDTFFASYQYGKWLTSDVLTYVNGTQIKAFSMGNNVLELTKNSNTQFTVSASSNIRIDKLRGVIYNV